MLARHSFNRVSRSFGKLAKDGVFAPNMLVMKIQSEGNRLGLMEDILRMFRERKLQIKSADGNLVRKDLRGIQKCLFQFSFEKPAEASLLQALEHDLQKESLSFELVNPPHVPWFPVKESDLDWIGSTAFQQAHHLDLAHPYFKDEDYRKRRNMISDQTYGYRMGSPIPEVEYTTAEQKVWEYVCDKVRPLHKKHACKEYLTALKKLEKAGLFSPKRIPQLEDLNAWLKSESNWRIKPVNGLLSQREFLNTLAFRTFCSTQYIRHPNKPEFSPEPDFVHEFLGHIPNLANPQICDISQMLGILSLGATDSQIAILGAIYWFTIEFGLCMENDQIKFYGAGPAGSFGEIHHAMKIIRESPKNILKLDLVNNPPPVIINDQDVQEFYYVAQSFGDFLSQIEAYSTTFHKPFTLVYDEQHNSFEVDRALQILSTVQTTTM